MLILLLQIIRDLKARPLPSLPAAAGIRYGSELSEGGLEVFNDIGGNNLGGGEVGAVFEGLESPASPLRLRYGSRLSGSSAAD